MKPTMFNPLWRLTIASIEGGETGIFIINYLLLSIG